MGSASIASIITPEKKLNRNLVYDSPGIVNDLFVISCYSDLSKLYTLLKHIPRGLQAMVTELEEHITKTGKNSQTVILFSCHLQCSSHDLKSTKQARGGGGGRRRGIMDQTRLVLRRGGMRCTCVNGNLLLFSVTKTLIGKSLFDLIFYRSSSNQISQSWECEWSSCSAHIQSFSIVLKIEKDVFFFRLVTSVGQIKNSESPWGIEPQML